MNVLNLSQLPDFHELGYYLTSSLTMSSLINETKILKKFET